jgi:hypothetical protein
MDSDRGHLQIIACPFRKSYPDVLVMQLPLSLFLSWQGCERSHSGFSMLIRRISRPQVWVNLRPPSKRARLPTPVPTKRAQPIKSVWKHSDLARSETLTLHAYFRLMPGRAFDVPCLI